MDGVEAAVCGPGTGQRVRLGPRVGSDLFYRGLGGSAARGGDIYQSSVIVPIHVLGQPAISFKNRMLPLKS